MWVRLQVQVKSYGVGLGGRVRGLGFGDMGWVQGWQVWGGEVGGCRDWG